MWTDSQKSCPGPNPEGTVKILSPYHLSNPSDLRCSPALNTQEIKGGQTFIMKYSTVNILA